ncbi:MAG: type IV pilus biogenesis/stability protein PilW [Proteobacteria bacterium]|nr:type IV pilus biogenesis/stability protein PilW [Pseudomonadota bacterium]
MPIFRRVLFQLAIAALLMGCQSAKVVKQSAAKREKLAEISTQLGVEYIQKGDLEAGLARLKRALEVDPNYVDAHNSLGLLYGNLGQYEKAERSFKRALAIEPNNSSALNNYGQYMCQLKRYDEGRKLLLKAIENPLYKNSSAALSNAGICALNAGDVDTAEKHFRAALRINPTLAPALYQMVNVSYRNSRYLPARGYLQRYMAVGRHTAKSLWLGVQIEHELGDKDAEASYELRLEKNFPDSEETRLLGESKAQ